MDKYSLAVKLPFIIGFRRKQLPVGRRVPKKKNPIFIAQRILKCQFHSLGPLRILA